MSLTSLQLYRAHSIPRIQQTTIIHVAEANEVGAIHEFYSSVDRSERIVLIIDLKI